MILAAIALVVFIVLAIYIIQTLITLQASLRKMNALLTDTDIKLKKLTSVVNTIENVGEVAERETERLKMNYVSRNLASRDAVDPGELAGWLISGLKLGIKIFKKG